VARTSIGAGFRSIFVARRSIEFAFRSIFVTRTSTVLETFSGLGGA
jgi:hypothetical protein